MEARRRVGTGRRRATGVRSIKRDSYFTVNGMNTRTGWYDLQKAVAKRSGGRCESYRSGTRCASAAREVHHIVPLSRGGPNVISNLIHLCLQCHNARHNHLFRSR